ncbi:hypothetical protein JAAARDRAFT_168081, partial [Jaapia argillacea MUCL 33604]
MDPSTRPFIEALRSNQSILPGIDLCAELSQAQAHVSALDDQIADLKRKREGAFLHVQDIQSLSSPIRHLPPEILSEVFMDCLDQDHKGPLLHTQPLLLSAVCCHWRVVALATPALWSTISFQLRHEQPQDLERISAALELFMARSAASPLSL